MKMALKEIKDTCKNWKQFCQEINVNPKILNGGYDHVELNFPIIVAHKYGIVKLNNIENYSKPCVKCKQPVGFWTEICNFCDTNQLKILRQNL